MSVINEPIEEEETHQVIPFSPRVISGGKDGVTPWILLLEEGSTFLIRNEKESKSELLLCRLKNIYSENTVVLFFPRSGGEHYVYPPEFCKDNKLHEILHRGEILGE